MRKPMRIDLKEIQEAMHEFSTANVTVDKIEGGRDE